MQEPITLSTAPADGVPMRIVHHGPRYDEEIAALRDAVRRQDEKIEMLMEVVSTLADARATTDLAPDPDSSCVLAETLNSGDVPVAYIEVWTSLYPIDENPPTWRVWVRVADTTGVDELLDFPPEQAGQIHEVVRRARDFAAGSVANLIGRPLDPSPLGPM